MLKAIKAITTAFGIMTAGMAGGQGKTGGKAPRRFGISLISILAAGLKRGWPFLLLIPLLSMGYGKDSVLMSWIGSDLLVRLVYGALMSIPFIFFGWRRWAFAAVSLSIAFLIEAGSAGYIDGFGDILIEDAIRYGTLGVLIMFNVYWPRKKK